jgi:murein DD-endopeptidase MepM/ murein hydrolase activator NlpD
MSFLDTAKNRVLGVYDKIISGWGASRSGVDGGGNRKHKGIDLKASRGQGIGAYTSGTVTRAAWDKKAGNYVDVTLDNGYVMRVAHLDRVDVTKGQKVERGQLLGLVGDTGNAKQSGPHIHFQLKQVNGNWFNPALSSIRPLWVAVSGAVTSAITPGSSQQQTPAPAAQTVTTYARADRAKFPEHRQAIILTIGALLLVLGFLRWLGSSEDSGLLGEVQLWKRKVAGGE